jgi:hypothetical protein
MSIGKPRSSRIVNLTVTGSAATVLTDVIETLTPVLGEIAPLGPNVHT